MSHLEALLASALHLIGVPTTETGINTMTMFFVGILVLVALMVVLVAYLRLTHTSTPAPIALIGAPSAPMVLMGGSYNPGTIEVDYAASMGPVEAASRWPSDPHAEELIIAAYRNQANPGPTRN